MNERPQTDAVRLANSQEFCQAILDDVEFHFRRHFGAKWTTKEQALFEQLQATCISLAQQADTSFRAEEVRALREPVLLTMGTRRG